MRFFSSTNPTHMKDLLFFHRGPNPSIDFLQPRPMPPLNIGIFHSSIPWFQNVRDGPLVEVMARLLGQWLKFKLFGITYLVGIFV